MTNPALHEVEDAVRRLDNACFNDLYLQPNANDSEIYLCVGAGAGRYVLAGVMAGERFPILIDPDRPAEPVQLVTVGGQQGDYPANAVHDLDTTLRAVRAFWTTGGFDSAGLTWA